MLLAVIEFSLFMCLHMPHNILLLSKLMLTAIPTAPTATSLTLHIIF